MFALVKIRLLMRAGVPQLAEKYEPAEVEAGCAEAWEKLDLFSSQPTAKEESGYCIVLPPPNVTGTLHMGHAFQHTLMDALSRHQRMLGRDVLWQPGTDHAGIATQLVVTRELADLGTDAAKLGRERMLEEIWKWKGRSGSAITAQMRKMGASCDWSRERFTMDEDLSRTVTEVFVRLHAEGLIYRGKRMVNWDPRLLTALSDLEVVAEEEDGVLLHVRYPFVDDPDNGMIIATTRPETILVDGALAVAPGDSRYAAFVGRRVRVPRTDRVIEVIEDEHVDAEFGSGCVKVTAAHDFNDYEVYLRHPDKCIPVLNLMTPDARLNENSPPQYRGLDRYEARRRIVNDLREEGLLLKSEPHRYMLPRGERSGEVVEPMLTDQWFVRAAPLAERALAAVREGRLRFVPGSWRKIYEGWLDNVRDWCISRQIIWGHRIPAWHDGRGGVFVGSSEAEARAQCGDDRELKRDPDVLDTWFSSALWPLSTLGWPDTGNPHFKHYFPTSVLVTGFDIIFFWVARMVMMSEHFTGSVPFLEVYVTGLVRDSQGRKMSKSKGNVLDPLDLIGGIGAKELVEKRSGGMLKGEQVAKIAIATRKEYPAGIPAYGADALRMTFASLASYGRDVKFDLGRIGGHRHFCNKLWNAARYVLATCDGWDGSVGEPGFAERWIVSRQQSAVKDIGEHFASYRFDLIVRRLHRFFWDEFCDWYIEMSKTGTAAGGGAAAAARYCLAGTLAAVLRLAHPLIPFVTDKLWPHIGPLAGFSERSVMCAPYPVFSERLVDEHAERECERLRELVLACRSLRFALGVSAAARLGAVLESGSADAAAMPAYLARLARLDAVATCERFPPGDGPVVAASGMRLRLASGTDGWERRLRAQNDKLRAECDRLRTRLADPQFTGKAPPAVVDTYRRQLAEAEAGLAANEAMLRSAEI